MMNNQTTPHIQGPVCPVPLKHDKSIILGHGSGGRLTQKLIKEVFLPYIGSQPLLENNDYAKLVFREAKHLGSFAISTDAHVVSPLFYPGGDIGKLAVFGTVNDVAMSGAIPLYLTASFIIEEGLSINTLEKIVISMQQASREANVQIVAGDTKVIEKGKADGLFITTTGVGWIPEGMNISGSQAEPGDVILISGNLGDHGIAVLTARGELGLEVEISSDQAPLNHLIQEVLKVAPNVHVLRDPTRGGLATSLNEIATQSNVGISIEEASIPVNPVVSSVCELLGFDPLYVANEGKVIVILPENQAEAALSVMKNHKYGKNAEIIGRITDAPKKRVLLKTNLGTTRLVDVLSGEMLPRIC